MSLLRLDVERLAVGLHGVSAGTAEQVGERLQEALGRRLALLDVSRWGPGLDLDKASLGRLPIEGSMEDPDALAGIVADRLVEWMERAGSGAGNAP